MGETNEQGSVELEDDELFTMLTSSIAGQADRRSKEYRKSKTSLGNEEQMPKQARSAAVPRTLQSAQPNPLTPSMTMDSRSEGKRALPLSASSAQNSLSGLSTSQMMGGSASRPLLGVDSPPFNPIAIPAGSFKVELRIDNREVRTKSDRTYIPAQLEKAGIACEQRALGIGDIVWVARIHDQSVISTLDRSDWEQPEIILDHIVERKRLDDLDASIKDKRFAEQKWRLSRSGVRHVTYLIEDYGCVSTMDELQHNRLVSSIAETQIINGFSVERTRKLDDTIAYLARKTRLLKEIYEQKALTVIPISVLTAQNHLKLRTPKSGEENHHYITYEAFQNLASKSKNLTVRDVFLKMLMVTWGITADKAVEVQKHWRTPHELVDAFASLDEPAGSGREAASKHAREKTEMIAKVAGQLVGRRKIGKAASTKVAETWGFEAR